MAITRTIFPGAPAFLILLLSPRLLRRAVTLLVGLISAVDARCTWSAEALVFQLLCW